MKSEIEIFRILSAFGIVWFHSGIDVGSEIAYGGLIYFVVVSVYFATISTRTHTISERAERLLFPFVLWGVFYGTVLVLMKGYIYPEDYALFSMIFASPSMHLWFLPFIFLSLVAIDKIRHSMSREWVVTLVGASALFSIALAPIWREFEYVPPLGQYAHAFPAVLIGLFLGVMNGTRAAKLLVVGILVSIIIMVSLGQKGIGITYLVGLIPCYFLFNGRTEDNKNSVLIKMSSATFGVYLLHIFVLRAFQKLDLNSYLIPVLAFLVSLVIVMFMQAYAPRKIVKNLV